LFYDVAGPYFSIQAYAGMNLASNAAGTTVSEIVGVKASVGGEITIMSKRVAGFQQQLFDWHDEFGDEFYPAPASSKCESQIGATVLGISRCDRAAFVDEYEKVDDCVKNGGGKSCLSSTHGSPTVCGDASGGYECNTDKLFACLCYAGGEECFDKYCAACSPNALVCSPPQ
jgi:hypothetical protein